MYMKSIMAFFEKLTVGKKVLLLSSPIITLLISMKLAIIGLFLLIIIDLLTGIRKSLHLTGVGFNPFNKLFWGSIKSYLLRKTWRKAYEYGIGIIVISILETLVLGGTPITFLAKTFSLTEMAAVVPALIEIWSIFENLEAVSGSNILKRLRPFMPKIVRAILGDDTIVVADVTKTRDIKEVIDKMN